MLAALVMVVVAWLIQKLVLGRLVNQDGITLLMATLGITYFLEGAGQAIFGNSIYKIDIGMPKDPVFIFEKTFQGGLLINKEDLYAAAIAAVLVAVLRALLPEDEHRSRALRAVADDHQAAQSIGIPLDRIWVIVWAVAGIVALVAGVIWGSKLGVQFSLSLVALEGAAGRDPRRAHVDPGRHHRRADHRRRREALGDLSRPDAGRRHRDLVCLRARARLPSRPAARLVRREDHRPRLTMLYRENGQFKTTYRSDQQIFPILQDRIAIGLLLLVAFVGVPLVADEYAFRAILVPFLILSLAALGLNILVGYCGQISLGTGAFMAVGAYAAYNFMVRIDGMPLLVALLLGGLTSTVVGVLFGIPSLRIKGLYLAVATLAAQFFADWAFLRVPFFTNNSSSGSVSVPSLSLFGIPIESPVSKYLFCLTIVCVFALLAKNLVRGHLGREWMAIRDMDVAAAVIGIRPVYAKLTAFAVSSFIVGVAGALWGFVYLGSWEPAAFSIDRSFQLLFMVIIGGLGSIMGSFFGAGFIVLLPLFLSQVPRLLGIPLTVTVASHLEFMIFGALIVFFLIVEPARPGAPVVDGQGKASPLALPALTPQCPWPRQVPIENAFVSRCTAP